MTAFKREYLQSEFSSNEKALTRRVWPEMCFPLKSMACEIGLAHVVDNPFLVMPLQVFPSDVFGSRPKKRKMLRMVRMREKEMSMQGGDTRFFLHITKFGSKVEKWTALELLLLAANELLG